MEIWQICDEGDCTSDAEVAYKNKYYCARHAYYILGCALGYEVRPTKRAADLLPCGHHKDALVDNGERQWCVACEVASR